MKIRCPHCSQKIAVEQEDYGTTATCPNGECGLAFRVPKVPPEHSQHTTDPTTELSALELQYQEHERKYTQWLAVATFTVCLAAMPILLGPVSNPLWPYAVILGVIVAIGMAFVGVLHNMRRFGRSQFLAPLYLVIVFLTAGFGSIILDLLLDKNRRRIKELRTAFEKEGDSARRLAVAPRDTETPKLAAYA